MIVLVDYKTCNLGSTANMLKRAGGRVRVAERPEDLEGATKIILPGIGAFDTCARNLREAGFEEPIRQHARSGKPLLGICVGAQLLTHSSAEGVEPGLGLIDAETRRFQFPEGSLLKVPHMGWNDVHAARPHSLLSHFHEAPRFYFVHSYYLAPRRPENVLAYSDYGGKFASAIIQDNVIGLQFHPEKSHRFGQALLKAFVSGGEA